MSKFHINKHGIPAPCKAKQGNCPLGGDDQHFSTREEAQEVADRENEKKHSLLPGVKEGNKLTPEQEEKVMNDYFFKKTIENLHEDYKVTDDEGNLNPDAEEALADFLEENHMNIYSANDFIRDYAYRDVKQEFENYYNQYEDTPFSTYTDALGGDPESDKLEKVLEHEFGRDSFIIEAESKFKHNNQLIHSLDSNIDGINAKYSEATNQLDDPVGSGVLDNEGKYTKNFRKHMSNHLRRHQGEDKKLFGKNLASAMGPEEGAKFVKQYADTPFAKPKMYQGFKAVVNDPNGEFDENYAAKLDKGDYAVIQGLMIDFDKSYDDKEFNSLHKSDEVGSVNLDDNDSTFIIRNVGGKKVYEFSRIRDQGGPDYVMDKSTYDKAKKAGIIYEEFENDDDLLSLSVTKPTKIALDPPTEAKVWDHLEDSEYSSYFTWFHLKDSDSYEYNNDKDFDSISKWKANELSKTNE